MILAWLGLAPALANAVVLTNASQLSSGNTFIDFETYPTGAISNPLVIGDVTFSSTNMLSVENISIYGASGSAVSNKVLRSNGPFFLTPTYVDTRIDFAVPIREFGLGWFDPNISTNFLEAYDSLGQLLESAAIPNFEIGGSRAVFRGFFREESDIAYVVARVSDPGDLYAIDNVSFGRIPEPSLPMCASAGILLALLARGALGKRPDVSRRVT